MAALLALNNATVLAGGLPILDDVSIEVAEGEMIAIIGANGSGKTTLIKALLGLVSLDSGTVQVEGKQLSSMGAKHRASVMAWLPQEGSTTDALLVEDVVAASRYRFDEPRAVALEAAHIALAEAGAGDLARRWVTELSGGERQRVELATMVAQQARCWLLDEPANHLDPVWRARTLRFLDGKVSEGTTALVALHDVHLLGHVDASRTRVIGLREGKIVWQGQLDHDQFGQGLEQIHGVPFHRMESAGNEFWLPAMEEDLS